MDHHATGDFHPFLWDPVTGMQDLGNLGGRISEGRGINARSQVTGFSTTPEAPFIYRAFLWDPMSGMQDIGTLGGHFATSYGINDSGQVTGSSNTAGNVAGHAFLWDPGTGMQDLGTLGGDRSEGRGINARGQVTGFSNTATADSRAFLWDPVTGMLDLNDLIAPGSGWTLGEGLSISDAGQITGSGLRHPLIFEHGRAAF
jgi:probable HAF family extracellular repeat protein